MNARLLFRGLARWFRPTSRSVPQSVNPRPEIGARATIRRTDVTERAGIAGLEAIVYGWTRPSISGAEVLGPCPNDWAINVKVSERDTTYWLAPEHVEFDTAPGFE